MTLRLSDGMQLPNSSSQPSDGDLADRPRWPWIALGAWVLLAAASVGLNAGSGTSGDSGDLWVGPVMGGYAVVGALVGTRRDGQRIGWLLLAVALGATVDAALAGYGVRGNASGSLPADGIARWLTSWFEEPFILGVVLFLPLLFPSGRLASSRWRIVAAFGVVMLATVVVGEAFGNDSIELDGNFSEPNPMRLADPAGPILASLAGLASAAFALPVALAIGGLVLRLRHAQGVERQQLKWLAYAALLLGIGLVLLGISSVFEGPGDERIGTVAWTIFIVTAGLGLPAAVGVAVLRHRLYDIDVVIRRTIVYSILSAILAGAYVASILLLREVAQPLTGDSGIAVAISTLAVAALFRPARTWIGASVDRRFYRAHYDTARTLTAFGVRLRHELDADTVSDDVRAVVHETLHPTHVSIWLLDPKKRG
jgi:hypothetical protein